jgi:hypothetical protein
MLCCGFPGCPPAGELERSRHFSWNNGRPSVTYSSKATLNDRQGSFGTLVDVLKHLHADHNEVMSMLEKTKWRMAPQFHLSLPLEVACTVSALLDVHDLDPTTATKVDLVTASKGSWYQWENAPRTKRNFGGKGAWFDLVRPDAPARLRSRHADASICRSAPSSAKARSWASSSRPCTSTRPASS